MELLIKCPHCSTIETYHSLPSPCVKCQQEIAPHANEDFLEREELTQCPACGARHLYRQKDFNRRLGMFILLLGIGFSFVTYGISLLAVTLIDLWLYWKVGEVACCYKCLSQYRGIKTISKVEIFNLQIHDYYRSVAATSGA